MQKWCSSVLRRNSFTHLWGCFIFYPLWLTKIWGKSDFFEKIFTFFPFWGLIESNTYWGKYTNYTLLNSPRGVLSRMVSHIGAFLCFGTIMALQMHPDTCKLFQPYLPCKNETTLFPFQVPPCARTAGYSDKMCIGMLRRNCPQHCKMHFPF
ncbi:hypothetical protein GDO81_022139 [Engystomops pustulosus]|uniref:ShKT domain-containing protein n=1 Tax=Engystomops pustulosus TaxID=76066 RepID=A0AAV6YUZ8_ENGPU|nr:hypothetical protein GDO81_022139 [Engystomops pustulosus]